MSVDEAIALVRAEVISAMKKHGPMASAHEGYAVIQEEVDELWTEVKHGSLTSARPEAVQVAAMAVRFLVDLYGDAPEELPGVCPAKWDKIYPCQRPAGHEGRHTHTAHGSDGSSVSWDEDVVSWYRELA